MRDQPHVGRPAFGLDEHFKVLRRGILLGAEFDVRGVRGQAVAGNVRRQADRPQRHGRAELHVDLKLAQRMLPQHFALQGVLIAIRAAAQRQHLGVGDRDAFLRLGRNGEHAGLEQVAAGPFQQARVAALAEDGLVNLAGALFLDHVGLDEPVADPHAEAGNRGVLRQREVKDALQRGTGMVDERFLDGGAGDLVADVDRHLVVADRKRHVAAVYLGHQRAQRFGGGLAVVAAEPGWLAVDADELPAADPIELFACDGDLLPVGPDEFQRQLFGGRDLQLAVGHAKLTRGKEFDQCAGAQHDDGLGHQP